MKAIAKNKKLDAKTAKALKSWAEVYGVTWASQMLHTTPTTLRRIVYRKPTTSTVFDRVMKAWADMGRPL